MKRSINTIAKDNYVEIIYAKIEIIYFKFYMQRIFNSLNINFKKIDNKNIIHIKRDNNIDNKINKDIKIDINKNEVDFFYVINKDIILYSRRLFQIIKCLI